MGWHLAAMPADFKSLRLRQNGRHLDNIFKSIFFIKISLKFVPKGPITNIPALV